MAPESCSAPACTLAVRLDSTTRSELMVLLPLELFEKKPPEPTVRRVPATLLLRVNPAPVNWMALTLTLPTSLTLVLRTAVLALKTMVGLESASGVPPEPQLFWLDQRVLAAPVQ